MAGDPSRAALRDEDPQVGVTVQGAARDHVGHHPHARVRGLHVVDDRAAGPAEDDVLSARADVEAEYQTGPLDRRPQRLPAVERVLLALAGGTRQEDRLEAQLRHPLHLGDRVVDVGRGDAGGGDDPLVLAEDLLVGPVVPGPYGLPGQLPVGDRHQPEPHGGEGQLGPHTLLVEVLEADLQVPGARRTHGVHEVAELAVDALPVDVEHLVLLAALAARARAPSRAGSLSVHTSAGSITWESPELTQIFVMTLLRVRAASSMDVIS